MIGFVYLLRNEYMDDLFKVGCTERSPHERAAELSKPTGVPFPFRVVCYIEVSDFQQVEKDLHSWLKPFRVSPDREFFYGCFEESVRYMYFLPTRKLAFTAVDMGFISDELGSVEYWTDPWNPPAPKAEPTVEQAPAAVLTLVSSEGEANAA